MEGCAESKKQSEGLFSGMLAPHLIARCSPCWFPRACVMAQVPAAPFGQRGTVDMRLLAQLFSACGSSFFLTQVFCHCSVNGFSFHRLGSPHFHRVTPGGCGSARARGGSGQGRPTGSRLPCKAKEPQCLFSFVRTVARTSRCRHCAVFRPSHQRGAGTATCRTLGPRADPHMAQCVSTSVLDAGLRQGLRCAPGICSYAVLGV